MNLNLKGGKVKEECFDITKLRGLYKVASCIPKCFVSINNLVFEVKLVADRAFKLKVKGVASQSRQLTMLLSIQPRQGVRDG